MLSVALIKRNSLFINIFMNNFDMISHKAASDSMLLVVENRKLSGKETRFTEYNIGK